MVFAGFFGHHRQHIRSIVQSSGGTYSGDLLEDYTTHLVYKDLAAARRGEKYTTALAWGIPVLPFSWLEQSLAQQRLLPANCQTSTETMTALASPATKLHMLSLQVWIVCEKAALTLLSTFSVLLLVHVLIALFLTAD